jgi:SAM-dependent methyltransferase
MVQVARKRLPDRPLRILDYGCGTGFEAAQLLNALPPNQIAEFWCYDLSPEMLDRCRDQIGPRFSRARFTCDLDELHRQPGQFDLLATNSLLHHLPSPFATITSLEPLMRDDSIWLCGHEPSARYYRNPACREAYERFQRQHRRGRVMSPSAYIGFAVRHLGLRRTPAQSAARLAYRDGLFERRPSARLIARLVDFHVAHSAEEAQSGRGFDVDQMPDQLSSRWTLQWTQSYSFMGAHYEGGLPRRWQLECERLMQKFPRDGANFCAVWQRVTAPQPKEE